MQVQLLLPFPETKDGTKGTSGSPSLPGIASLQSLSAAQVIVRLSLWDAARGLIPGAGHEHHPSACLRTHMGTCGCPGIAWEPTEVDGCRRSREDWQGFGLVVALPGCSITRIWGITDFSLCSCSRDGSGRRGALLHPEAGHISCSYQQARYQARTPRATLVPAVLGARGAWVWPGFSSHRPGRMW